MPTTEHHHEVVFGDEVTHGVAELALGGLEVGAVGGDIAGVGKQKGLLDCKTTQRGAKRGWACGCADAAFVAADSLVRAKTNQGDPTSGNVCSDNVVPSRTVCAALPHRTCACCIHAAQLIHADILAGYDGKASGARRAQRAAHPDAASKHGHTDFRAAHYA